jgi:hypothetical protein
MATSNRALEACLPEQRAYVLDEKCWVRDIYPSLAAAAARCTNASFEIF